MVIEMHRIVLGKRLIVTFFTFILSFMLILSFTGEIGENISHLHSNFSPGGLKILIIQHLYLNIPEAVIR